MIIAKVLNAAASVRLWMLMQRVRDPAKVYKIWGIKIVEKLRSNARAKGGRKLWKQIADSVRLDNVSQRGADVDVVGLWGRIGIHKEKGGPIRARKKNFLTIPIDPSAYGKTAAEYSMDTGVRLFSLRSKSNSKRVLAYRQNGTLVPVFALCKTTVSQRTDKWFPEHNWVLHVGIDEAKRLIREKK